MADTTWELINHPMSDETGLELVGGWKNLHRDVYL